MTLNIFATWHHAVDLKDDDFCYACPKLSSVPLTPGVYVFCRQYGDVIVPMYIGQGMRLRTRIEQQLNNNALTRQIKKAKTGHRIILYCTIDLKSGQQPKTVLRNVESALIAHALAQGHQLINQHGTKFKQNTIKFKRNRASEAIVPRFMRIRTK